MRVTTGTRLKQLMNERDLKQIDILRLSEPFQKELNISLSKSALSQYVNDVQSPDQYKLTLLGKTLNVSEAWLMGYDVPKEVNVAFGEIDEIDILSIYNKLKESRQKKVYNYAEKQLHEQESTIEENNICYLPTVDNSAAAANPTELAYGDISIEEQAFVDVPAGADFAVPIHGDSMEPLIENGSYVFVKTQDTIENGEIALVEIDNDGVTCKKVYLNPDQGTITLHSLNSEYDDREIDPDRVRIIGKVLI